MIDICKTCRTDFPESCRCCYDEVILLERLLRQKCHAILEKNKEIIAKGGVDVDTEVAAVRTLQKEHEALSARLQGRFDDFSQMLCDCY